MIEDHEINHILGGHFSIFDKDRELQRQMRDAADNHLWERPNRYSGLLQAQPEALPVKRQVNTLRPWLVRQVAALYLKAPKPVIAPPVVLSARAGTRKVSQDTADTLRAVGEEWLQRVNVRQQFEQGLEMALMGQGAGLKFGYDGERKGTPLDRVWLEPVPRWECIWDERATAYTERFRGHLRWEPIDRARELLDDELDGVDPSPIADFLVDGAGAHTDRSDRHSGYVQVLDWYDLSDRRDPTFEVLLVQAGAKPTIDRRKKPRKAAKELKVPYTWPDGSPLLTLEPIILANSAGFPMRAVSLAKPVFDETCEKSLLLSVVLNSFRRDAARVILYLKNKGLTEAQVERITRALDTEFVGIDSEETIGMLDKLFVPLKMPDLATTLQHAREWLTLSSAEQSTMSAIGRGSTEGIEYAPATTTAALAAGDQAATSAPAERMRLVLARVTAAMFRIVGEEGRGLKVRRGDSTETLSPEVLRAAWKVDIEDAAATAQMRAAKRADITTALPLYQGLVATASSVAPKETEGWVPDEVKVAAQRGVDLVADAFEFGDQFRWEALRGKSPDVEAEEPPEPAGAAFTPGVSPASAAAAPVANAPLTDPVAARLAQLPPEQLEALAATVEAEGA